MQHSISMKRTVLKSSALAGILSLLLLFPWFGWIKSSTLTDISKPYLGVYECKQAKLGDTDVLERFSYIKLELEEEEFTLYYREKEGEAKSEKGKYRYNKERQTLTMCADEFAFIKKEYPLQNGVLTIDLRIGDRAMLLVFEQV